MLFYANPNVQVHEQSTYDGSSLTVYERVLSGVNQPVLLRLQCGLSSSGSPEYQYPLGTPLLGASDELFVAVTDSERTNFTVIDFVG